MKLATRIFAGFVIISFIFTAVILINIRLSEEALENSQWVSKSQAVVKTSSALQRHIVEMETGMRGFLLTGNEDFLEPYYAAKRQIPAQFSNLEYLVKDSPVQIRQVQQIKNTHQRWVNTFTEALISQKRSQTLENDQLKNTGLQNLKNADNAMVSGGKKMMDSMRSMFIGLNNIENQVSESRLTRLRNSIHNTRLFSTIMT
ncbi:MAG: CHASE3 domain-containing protein, partial [Bacteroidota bacterium]|nr:CHASE3 domain-containing protein [Bacteroidota bacterium]